MDKFAAMRLLVSVVRTQSISRGAQAEGISTATATQRIANLERELGAKLLNRNTRGVSLTEQGEICYQTSLRILADMEQLEQSVASEQMEASGVVRINCNTAIGRAIVLPGLAEFSCVYPAIKLHLVLSDSRAQFVRDKVDFSVRIGGLEDQDLVMRKLGCARRVLVASPGYLQQYGWPATPEDLKTHRLIDFLLPETTQTLPWEFRDCEITARENSFAINDGEARIQMAVQGLGIVQSLGFLCRDHLASGALVRLLADWEVDAPDVSILYPRNRHLPRRVSLVMDHMARLISSKLENGRAD